MRKIDLAVSVIIFALCAHTRCAARATQDEGPSPAGGGSAATENAAAGHAPNYTLDFNDIMLRLLAAKDGESALGVIKETCSECRTYDDYEKLASDLKSMAQDASAENKDVLYYGLGRIRIEQLLCLSKSNDLEAGRLYMSVNDRYYSEALHYLDRAAATASKSLIIDVNLLKFLVFKEKFQSEKSDAILDGIAAAIARYSSDPRANLRELARVCGELDRMGLVQYGTKLKIIFAAKADRATARGVLDEIKKAADGRFANHDLKNATYLYEQYAASAPAYFEKEEMATKVMEIAEKYFAAGKHKEARRYYEAYCASYGESKVVDYCSYKIAMCYNLEKDYVKAQDALEGFLTKYQNSVWFDKAFEMLAKLYYEQLPRVQAIEGLQRLVDNYYRKNTGDFAQVLIGLLYYRAKNYETAVEKLQKVDPTSMYSFAAQTILDDIKQIREQKAAPKFGSDISDSYKVWDPHMPTNGAIVPTAGGQKLETTTAGDGSLQVEVGPGTQIQVALEGLDDKDRFNEYQLDKEDLSRLPKELREETEPDLLVLHWASENGSFADDKESPSKSWKAPSEPGTYKISAKLDDFGLVRTPDKGLRKDAAKDLTLVVVVK